MAQEEGGDGRIPGKNIIVPSELDSEIDRIIIKMNELIFQIYIKYIYFF